MNDLATLARIIENLIPFGTIAEAQMKPPACLRQNRFTDHRLATSWLALRAGADVDWDPPTVNEQLILLSPSGQLANAVAITGIYRDGAVIEYDSVTHHLRAKLSALPRWFIGAQEK